MDGQVMTHSNPILKYQIQPGEAFMVCFSIKLLVKCNGRSLIFTFGYLTYKKHMFMIMFSEILCPPVPVWTGLEATSTNTSMGTVVRSRCPSKDTNSGVVKAWTIAECTDKGRWTHEFPTCHGTSRSFMIISFYRSQTINALM